MNTKENKCCESCEGEDSTGMARRGLCRSTWCPCHATKPVAITGNTEHTKNSKDLQSFTSYCIQHPHERFWQALRNWAEVPFVLIANYNQELNPPWGEIRDTYFMDYTRAERVLKKKNTITQKCNCHDSHQDADVTEASCHCCAHNHMFTKPAQDKPQELAWVDIAKEMPGVDEPFTIEHRNAIARVARNLLVKTDQEAREDVCEGVYRWAKMMWGLGEFERDDVRGWTGDDEVAASIMSYIRGEDLTKHTK